MARPARKQRRCICGKLLLRIFMKTPELIPPSSAAGRNTRSESRRAASLFPAIRGWTAFLLVLSFGGVALRSFGGVEDRVDALLTQMTLDEKIGQMVQVDMAALGDKADIQKYYLGSMLSGGNSDPADNRAQTWLQAVSEYQSCALKTRLKIPLLYGIDAVHGHNNIDGSVIFPHDIS